MMQSFTLLSWLPLILIILGAVVVIYGLILYFTSSEGESIDQSSKGFILLGPIPIVWGFGWKGCAIAIVIAVLFLLLIVGVS